MNNEEERIEAYGNQRFKLVGDRVIAVEQMCFQCHQKYWQPVVSVSSGATALNAHQCPPDRQAGASVINKFG